MNRRTFMKTAGVNAGTFAIGGGAVLRAASGASQVQPSQAAPRAGGAVTADVAVLGAGVFGGWTALNLREMGLSVVLIDQYGPGNSKSSSGGEIRGMRATYGAQEHYSRWAMTAMELWKIREAEFGTRLFYQCGGLQVNREWTKQLTATRATFDKLKIPYEVVQHDDLVRRWPQMATETNEFFGFYTPFGGVLKAHDACVAVARAFEKKGGKFLLAKAALGPRTGAKLQSLTLSSGETISAGTFVVAAGPWLLTMFPEVLKNKLMVAKRGYYMVGVPAGDFRFSYPNLPNTGIGVPSVDGLGLAVLMGSGSKPVDPDTHDRVPTAEDKATIKQMLTSRFPALQDQPILNAHICQSDNTVDGNFIIDRHPEMENVWLVGGGSYHGFKFGPVSGDYIAHRVVGRDKSPELASLFTIKAETFTEGGPAPRVNDLLE
jgi:glycine/D-amino acid oxidase-like deaminating enzyme